MLQTETQVVNKTAVGETEARPYAPTLLGQMIADCDLDPSHPDFDDPRIVNWMWRRWWLQYGWLRYRAGSNGDAS